MSPSQNIEKIKLAAADPANWKIPNIKRPRKKTSKISQLRAREYRDDIETDLEQLNSVALVDAAITALVDLAPESFSWDVVNLCESLIESAEGHGSLGFYSVEDMARTETQAFMQVLTKLLSLYSPAVYSEAAGHISALMVASGVSVVMFGTTFAGRRDIIRKGWATA